jgi:spore coat protein H
MTFLCRAGLGVLLVLTLTSGAAAQSSDDFFNPNAVQRIELWLNAQDWAKLKASFQENTYYPADVVWNGQTAPNVGIRSRGLGSRRSAKPGLRVDIDRYSDKQTFLGLKSFVLDNLSQDPSGIKETVAMRFFTRLGIPAPRETHAQLFVNGEYAGLYGLVESVDKTMMGRVFGSIGDNVQNDGYLFEYNYIIGSPWRFEYLGSALDPYKARFDIKTNETKGDVAIWGPIEELVRLVNNTPASSFEQTVGALVDLPGFVRYIAAQNFIAQDDGFNGYDGMNNFYFYRLEDSTKHVFIGWDEDVAFLSPQFSINTRLNDNRLTRLTLEVPAFQALYYSSLLDAATSASDWLQQEIQRQLAMIGDSMQSDPNKEYSNSEHAAARDAMLAFGPERISVVRCDVAAQTGTPRPAGC